MREISSLLPYYETFLSELVKIPSYDGTGCEAQDYVYSEMRRLGIGTKVFYNCNDRNTMNLVGTRPGTSPEYRSLILNAHCDTWEIKGEWEKPPLSGAIIGDELYGRGAWDDKAGIAIMLMLFDLLRDVELKGDLIIESVMGDNGDGEGSKKLVEFGYTADGVLIIDGTWPERIIYGHLGKGGYVVPKDNPLITLLRRIIESKTHREVNMKIVDLWCDMRHFPTKNICLYGPGGGKNPHSENEYYFLSHMPIVAQNILDFILEWCNGKG